MYAIKKVKCCIILFNCIYLKQDGRYHNGDILDEDEPVDIEGDGDGDNHDLDEYDWMRSRRHLRPYHHDSSSNYPCKLKQKQTIIYFFNET